MNRTAVSPWVTWGLYIFAITLIVSPLTDLTTTVWPFRFGDMGWRYGLLGLTAGYLHTPLLGLVLGMAVAYWQGHTGALRIGGILSLVGVAVLLLAMPMFAMDVLGMRAVRPEDTRAGILVGGVLQEVKYAGACVVLVCLGFGGTQTARRLDSSGSREAGAPGILRR